MQGNRLEKNRLKHASKDNEIYTVGDQINISVGQKTTKQKARPTKLGVVVSNAPSGTSRRRKGTLHPLSAPQSTCQFANKP